MMALPRGTELYNRGVKKGQSLERARSFVDFKTWLSEHEDQVIIKSKFLARDSKRRSYEAVARILTNGAVDKFI